MTGKVNKLKKFLVAGVCALVCFTSVDGSDALAFPSWPNDYVYYNVIKRGYHNTAHKKHKNAHKYAEVPYAKTRKDATCKMVGTISINVFTQVVERTSGREHQKEHLISYTAI